MPNMSVIHVPDVLVFRSEGPNYTFLPEPFWVGVAAASLRQADTENEHINISKVEGVLRVAYANGYRHLVLGAWGCGAF